MDQNRTGCDFLAVDLASVHVFDGRFRPVRVYKVHVAKASRERLEPIYGEIDTADFTVRSENLQDVVLDDVAG